MRNVIVKTPLRFSMMGKRVEPIESRLVRISSIVLAQPGSSKEEWKEDENSATLHNNDATFLAK
jgi:hypothetical protein